MVQILMVQILRVQILTVQILTWHHGFRTKAQHAKAHANKSSNLCKFMRTKLKWVDKDHLHFFCMSFLPLQLLFWAFVHFGLLSAHSLAHISIQLNGCNMA